MAGHPNPHLELFPPVLGKAQAELLVVHARPLGVRTRVEEGLQLLVGEDGASQGSVVRVSQQAEQLMKIDPSVALGVCRGRRGDKRWER